MPLAEALRYCDGSVEDAALFLAKTAALLKRAEPGMWEQFQSSPYAPQNWDFSKLTEPVRQQLPSSMSPEMQQTLSHALVGGGIGGLGMGAMGLMQGKKKRQLTNSALAGILGGAGIGAIAPHLGPLFAGGTKSITSPEEILKSQQEKNIVSRGIDAGFGTSPESLGDVMKDVGKSVGPTVAPAAKATASTLVGPAAAGGAVYGARALGRMHSNQVWNRVGDFNRGSAELQAKAPSHIPPDHLARLGQVRQDMANRTTSGAASVLKSNRGGGLFRSQSPIAPVLNEAQGLGRQGRIANPALGRTLRMNEGGTKGMRHAGTAAAAAAILELLREWRGNSVQEDMRSIGDLFR